MIGGRVYAEIDYDKSMTTLLVVKAPPFYSKLVQETYGILKEEKLSGIQVADKMAEAEKAFDGKLSTSYQSAVTGSAYLGLDLEIKRAVVTKVRYYYNTLDGFTLNGVKIQGSKDNIAWTDLYDFGEQPNIGWNKWVPATLDYESYRYIQIRSNNLAFAIH